MKTTIREARPSEFKILGQLMVDVYSQLKGFPGPEENPKYYKLLANIGDLTKKPKVKLLVAITPEEQLGGGVVYFGDMQYYGSGGTATKEQNAAGFRLLAVDPKTRGRGLGKLLSQACIDLAKEEKQKQLIIHSTNAMQVAWGMYEKLGFNRSEDLDFNQGDLSVFGFRLLLS